MLEKTTLIKVLNRDNGSVSYKIPDLGNLQRVYAPNEEKEVPFEELVKLSYQRGGRVLMQQCLLIKNQEVVKMLLGEVPPEYFYTTSTIKTLLLSGTLDQLLDFLDFAPEGAIDLLKEYIVKLDIKDLRKIEAVTKKTGFNVSNAIAFEKASIEAEKLAKEKAKAEGKYVEEDTPATRRRSAPLVELPKEKVEEEKTEEKATTSKYEILD